VWWHSDLIHSVGAVADQRGMGQCHVHPGRALLREDAAYARACGQAFLAGASPADFAAEDYEVTWTGRATLTSLNPTGRAQLGL
jgi:Protein of unknown function (DUF1479)